MHKTFSEIVKHSLLSLKSARTFSDIQKFNPYHDKSGMFSSSNGFFSSNSGMGPHQISYSPDKKKIDKIAAGAVKEAQAREKGLTSDLNTFAAASGSQMTGLEYAVKTEKSLNEKLVTECKAAKTDPSEAIKRMYDINRYTMQNSPDKLEYAAKTTLSMMESKGYKVERIKNSFADEKASYRGMNTVIKAPDGSRFELQFHTEQSLKIKEANHKMYEEQRKDSTTPERRMQLDKMMADNLNGLVVPKGIETIKNIDYIKKG